MPEIVVEFDPDDGTVGDYLPSRSWYDARGQVVKTATANGLFQKRVYDGLGRIVASFTSDADATVYAEADDVSGDRVIQQGQAWYDQASQIIATAMRQPLPADASTTGAASAASSYVTATVLWYDGLGRTLATADFGREDVDSGLTHYVFDGTGGDAIDTNENGLPDMAEDAPRALDASYHPQQLVVASLTHDQLTRYVYGTTLADSGIASSRLKRAEIYPDSDDTTDPRGDGADAVYDRIEFKYNRQGEVTEVKDQNETIHAFDYDGLARRIHDRIMTLGSGVDGAVRRISTTYEIRGMVEAITSWDDATVGSGNVVNELAFEYNDLGMTVREYQEHAGAKDGNTLYVQYEYDTTASGGVFTHGPRPTSVRYPNGRRIHLDYGPTDEMADALGRLAAIRDDDAGSPGDTLAEYAYLGLARIVVEDYVEPEVRLDYDSGPSGEYGGFDRFGRVVDHRWYAYGASAHLDRYTYTYDRAGNRTTKANQLNHDFDEVYEYDAIDRLVSSARADDFDQSWTLDALGNFAEFDDDGQRQTRTANAANEITGITGGWITPTYDAAGNMVSGPRPGDETTRVHYVYDAWNRLVIVQADDSGDPGDTLAEYQYDGTNRRIQKNITEAGGGPSEAHYFYNGSWQLLEERFVDSQGATVASNQYVWSPRYIDALIVRFHDANADGDYLDAGDNVSYYTADANFNITAAIDAGSGDVAARYVYTAYGTATVHSATWTNPSAPATDGPLYGGYFFDAETVLYQVRNRYYDTSLSIFVSRDPIGYRGGRDLLAYCGNRPLIHLDPTGLEWHHWFPQGHGIPEKINQLCGGKLDIHQYTTWIDGSVTSPGTGHYWVHITENYNQKVLDLLGRANGDCCAFLMDMHALIYNMWASLYRHYGRSSIPQLSMRPYPGRYPGPRPSTLYDLMNGPTYKNICNDPCRKVRLPLPMPAPVPLPWWVPNDPNNDIYQDVGIGIVIGIIVIGGWIIVGPGAAAGSGGATILPIGGGGAVGGGGTVILPIAA